MAGEVRPRPSPAPSHSTPSLTALVCHRPAQRTTEIPANSRHHGPRAVPSVSSVLSLPPPGPSQTVIGAPKSACRPPGDLPPTRIQARIIAPVTPSHPSAVLTPSTCMNRWIRANPPFHSMNMSTVCGTFCGCWCFGSLPRSSLNSESNARSSFSSLSRSPIRLSKSLRPGGYPG